MRLCFVPEALRWESALMLCIRIFYVLFVWPKTLEMDKTLFWQTLETSRFDNAIMLFTSTEDAFQFWGHVQLRCSLYGWPYEGFESLKNNRS
jgi:hypothetical protein